MGYLLNAGRATNRGVGCGYGKGLQDGKYIRVVAAEQYVRCLFVIYGLVTAGGMIHGVVKGGVIYGVEAAE